VTSGSRVRPLEQSEAAFAIERPWLHWNEVFLCGMTVSDLSLEKHRSGVRILVRPLVRVGGD
jgi:hypothetical protein